MPQVVAAIAVGSNVGDRDAHVAYAAEAIGRLPGTTVLATGPVMRTAAVGTPGVEAGGEYLNTCVLVRTGLNPREMLDHLHRIERERGRDRSREGRWGPRTLDLDLIVHGEMIVDEPGLTLPHPRMHERRFVLEPLAAIAPDLVVPGRGHVVDLLRNMAACRAS
jgi:2-amino-4-hydroxy-6-hydroxymethyldihydropteridine diphosphokinase